MLAITADIREAVVELVETELGAGAMSARRPRDHGFMYTGPRMIPDGHHWEVMEMDPAAVAEALEATASAS